ncbi:MULTISPECIES: PqiC family protein [unclassified Brenneria]|uniref:PqiC family protein n=1 Tax=unclassified Brenneria TaxID=2634434 RepID=UPI0029C5AACD|nr:MULTISPECIES: PqiC family protein [unclassified Brenneria]MDX5629093.1 PqiC family protein [Brenneria sp. L3-3Z]MDX5696232.1 PqiC family protein [Brenneria sp. L4-2C]
MILISRLCLFTLLAALAGCSSPTVRYHTLVAPPTAAQNAAPPASFVIEVLPVGVPAQIDLPQLVVRQGESDALILDNERWLSPLGDEFRSALSAGLAERLGTQDVAGLNRTDEKPVVRIRLQVRRFDIWPGRFVRLESDWSLSARNGENRTQLVCHSRLTERAEQGDTAMFAAQQQAVARLTDQIAGTLHRWAANGQGSCIL